MGYLLKYEEGGEKILLEADTVSCNHCQKVLLKHYWRDQGGWCFSCGWAVCYTCFGKMQQEGCKPFKMKIDQAVDEMYKRRLW